MKQPIRAGLMWFYTILIVPAIIVLTFWLNGYFKL